VSLRYAFVFGLLAVAAGVFCVAAAGPTNGVSLVGLYPAGSFALLCVAYAGVGPKLLGKRADGGRELWARLLFAPYLLLTRFVFVLYRLFTRQPAVSEIAPGLHLGRRLGMKEARRFADAAVLDLAAEFSELPRLQGNGHYRSLPQLDTTAPTVQQLGEAVRWIADQMRERAVFVHCALGQGRSACVVLAYLLHAGRVKDVREGVKLLRQLRPGVGLTGGSRLSLVFAARVRTLLR
jgi:protein-tyrosine phosphatase